MNRENEILETLECQSLGLNDLQTMFGDVSSEIENLLANGRIEMVGMESDFNPGVTADSPMYILGDNDESDI